MEQRELWEKTHFNSPSHIGASLSQVTVLPKRRQAAEVDPMSRYLEAKNGKLYSTLIFYLSHQEKKKLPVDVTNYRKIKT